MFRGVIELIADVADLRRHLQWAIEEFWDGGIDVLRPRRAPQRMRAAVYAWAGVARSAPVQKRHGIIRGMSDDDEDIQLWVAQRDDAGNLVRVRQSLKENRRRSMLDRQRMEARFRAAPFPLYGLQPSWEGARFLGGGAWGGMPGRERTKSLSLIHGTLVQGQGPILGVETASEFSIGGGELLNAAGMVWEGRSLGIEEAFEELTRDDPHWDMPDAFPVRSELVFNVDEVPASFDAFIDGDEWVARAKVGSNFVTVEGFSFDRYDVDLVHIIDIEPYVLGTRQFYQRR